MSAQHLSAGLSARLDAIGTPVWSHQHNRRRAALVCLLRSAGLDDQIVMDALKVFTNKYDIDGNVIDSLWYSVPAW